VVVVGEMAAANKGPQQPRMTLILIEEVDLVFDGACTGQSGVPVPRP
jgi:hypothetical protein